jgi:poly(A) polymerase
MTAERTVPSRNRAPRPPSLGAAAWLADARLQAVLEGLTAEGGEARIAGGAVRNALCGEPVGDIDIATTEPPDRVMLLARRAGLGAHPTGVRHGTVTVVAAKTPFEVTTLRIDLETYGRHAKVGFTSDWAADAARRDFTMNALYCDRHGRVFDPLGGYADLRARRVRFVGEARARIREDYLRILRFFRFHARYGRGRLDPQGLAACVAERKGLARLSAERIRQELLKLLVAPGMRHALETMAATGILARILPGKSEPALAGRVAAIEAALGRSPDALLRLFALVPGAERQVVRLRDRLRLTNAETERLRRLAAAPPVTPQLEAAERKVMLYRLGPGLFRDAVLLAWARSRATPRARRWVELLTLADRWPPPVFPLRGQDLIAHGIAPGPGLGARLAALEDWWISAGFPADRAAILARLKAQECD